MVFHQARLGEKIHIQLTLNGPWLWVEKSGSDHFRRLNAEGNPEGACYSAHSQTPVKLEEGTPVTHWMGLTDVKRPKKVIGRTTRMFEVVMYEDGTADLCGFTFKPHLTLKIVGDGTLQNPLEIVPK